MTIGMICPTTTTSSHDTKRSMKDKSKNLNRAPQWHIHVVVASGPTELKFFTSASAIEKVVNRH